MNTLTNTINLLRESLSEANFYAKELELLLKNEENRKEQVTNIEKEKKKKSYQKNTKSTS